MDATVSDGYNLGNVYGADLRWSGCKHRYTSVAMVTGQVPAKPLNLKKVRFWPRLACEVLSSSVPG